MPKILWRKISYEKLIYICVFINIFYGCLPFRMKYVCVSVYTFLCLHFDKSIIVIKITNISKLIYWIFIYSITYDGY